MFWVPRPARWQVALPEKSFKMDTFPYTPPAKRNPRTIRNDLCFNVSFRQAEAAKKEGFRVRIGFRGDQEKGGSDQQAVRCSSESVCVLIAGSFVEFHMDHNSGELRSAPISEGCVGSGATRV